MEDINEGLNEGLKTVFQTIKQNPSIQAKEIADKLNNRPIKTVEKQISELTKKGLIERKGSRKTGGYWTVSDTLI